MKRQLARELCSIMEGWSQIWGAAMLRLRQPNLSLLRRGKLGDFSVNRLLRLIVSQGFNVEITFREMPKKIGRPRPIPTVQVSRFDRYGRRCEPR